jgi:hypothetical protein
MIFLRSLVIDQNLELKTITEEPPEEPLGWNKFFTTEENTEWR